MEASAVPAAEIARSRPRLRLSGPLLRLRSDEQLVALFRAGDEDAFGAIHDRYRARLFAYTRQMLPGSRADAEDALQDVFVRAYRHLRASDREVLLRPWLYRVAHNRCVDVLRRPTTAPEEAVDDAVLASHDDDPFVALETREDLKRIVRDVARLPEAQRSALLMREMDGLPYVEIAGALEVTIPAVKSLLVRARMGLAQAEEARQTACTEVREHLALAHDRGVRAGGLARRHLQECDGCRAFRGELRVIDQRLAMLAPPVLGPLAILAKVLGLGTASGGGAASGGTAAGAWAGGASASSAAAAGAAASGASVAGSAAVAAGGAVVAATATKVVAVAAVAAVAAGGHAKSHHHASVAPTQAPVVRSAPLPLRATGSPLHAPIVVAPPKSAPVEKPAASAPTDTSAKASPSTTADPTAGATGPDGTGSAEVPTTTSDPATTDPSGDSGQTAGTPGTTLTPSPSSSSPSTSSTAPATSTPPASSSSTGTAPTATSSSTPTTPSG